MNGLKEVKRSEYRWVWNWRESSRKLKQYLEKAWAEMTCLCVCDKELDTTELLNWTDVYVKFIITFLDFVGYKDLCNEQKTNSIYWGIQSDQLMSLELVMPSNHLTLCHYLLLPSIFASIRVFSSESVLRITWPKYWSFRSSISPSNEFPGLISWSPCSPGDSQSRVLSNTTVHKHQFFGAHLSVWSNSHMNT